MRRSSGLCLSLLISLMVLISGTVTPAFANSGDISAPVFVQADAQPDSPAARLLESTTQASGGPETLRLQARDSGQSAGQGYSDYRNRILGEPDDSQDNFESLAVPDEAIVEIDRAAVSFIPSSYEILDRISFGGDTEFLKLRIPSFSITSDTVRGLQALPGVKSVQPNCLDKLDAQPNDPMYTSGAQWWLNKVGAPAAWDVTTGSPNIVIAVVDSGVAPNHPDLAGKLVPGFNFVNNTPNFADDEGHGTMVAGVIAAATNNGVGVAGLSWGSKIMPLKAGDAKGIDVFTAAKAFQYAADHGARIINFSAGGPGTSDVVKTAIDYAISKGTLVVASAGNNPAEIDYPAAYDEVLAVGATNVNDEPAAFSVLKPYMDISAPGVGILTTSWDNGKLGYMSPSGTSFSSPMVAGAAALVISANPALSNNDVIAVLEGSTDDIDQPGWDNYSGWGRLNVAKAVTMAAGANNPPIPSGGNFPDSAFQSVWDRTDQPITALQASRSWMWGPSPYDVRSEPYTQSPGGSRQIVYLDKSRMEITNPGGDRYSNWFVTNGLLVRELIAGKVQVGDADFINRTPANVPVAGDPANVNPDGPTYATFANVANLNGDKRAPDRTGQSVIERIDKAGNISVDSDLTGQAAYAAYNPELGHNIPNVFWDWFAQQGTIYKDGKFVEGQVIDWVFAMGFPLSEPYWANVKVGGVDKLVLIQAFERRVLTYTPDNPDGWKVEMGNVGQHYWQWRYTGVPMMPAPQPKNPDVNAFVAPRYGPAGGDFYLVAGGFSGGEPVTIFAVRPDGTTVEPPLKATADGSGTVLGAGMGTASASLQGWWRLEAQGNWRGKKSVAYFMVTAPRNGVVTVTPGTGKPDTAFAVAAMGFVQGLFPYAPIGEPVDIAFKDPAGRVWVPQGGGVPANNNGILAFQIQPSKSFPQVATGKWQFAAVGEVSHVGGATTFTLAP